MTEHALWNIGDNGEFQFDPARERLQGGGKDVDLGPNGTKLLMLLIKNYRAMREFENDKIEQDVWGRNIGSNSLYQAIHHLREAFGERGHEYIRTRPYRLATKVKRATKRSALWLPEKLRRRIDELSVRPEIKLPLTRVLTAKDYPTLMTLAAESVINPIWRRIADDDRRRLAALFSPFGDRTPRFMHLDIFLLRAKDKTGRPRLFTYYSGKPISGWQAFLLPFRHRRPGENERTRQRENAEDIVNFLGLQPGTVHVRSLGDQFVVSVKPDAGYSELVTYIFEFCAVSLDIVPEWMLNIDCEVHLDNSVRRFRWVHPEEMEQEKRSSLVNGDLIRGIHYFFGTTLPDVMVGLPAVLRG
jgi:DNA-binding winged helix-turn-helix (wHTH) protein